MALQKVEAFQRLLLDAALKHKCPVITVLKVNYDLVEVNDHLQGNGEEDAAVLMITDEKAMAKRYLSVLTVFNLVAMLVRSGNTMSLRDVYYCSPLFKSQTESNAAVRDLGNILSLSRHEMGIIPVARGFCAGALRFRTRQVRDQSQSRSQSREDEKGDNAHDDMHGSGNNDNRDRNEGWSPWTDCSVPVSSGGQGVPISSFWSNANVEVELSVSAQTLVIIEKEGIFHRLCEDSLWKAGGRMILVTGCGQPDMATRALVRRLTDQFPRLLAVGLFDYNPYGVGILSNYRFGSSQGRLVHEGRNLSVPRIKWLGLRESQIQLQLQEHPPIQGHMEPLSVMDRRRLRGLLASANLEPSYKQSLLAMQQRGFKCELEALFVRGLHYPTAFIQRALIAADYI